MYLGIRAQWNNKTLDLDDQQKCELIGQKKKYHSHPNYGSSMLMPVSLCVMFSFIQWWYTNLATCIPALLANLQIRTYPLLRSVEKE